MQRKAKTYRKTPEFSIGGLKQLTFFREATSLLSGEGHEEAAFYFDQVKEYLETNYELPTSSREISRLLGL